MAKLKKNRETVLDGREEPRSTRAGEASSESGEKESPSLEGGKASTALPEGVVGCATDTIEDEDGHYLEPPD